MTTPVPYTPRPGVDQMTRDGQRVTGLRDRHSSPVLPLIGKVNGQYETWTRDGRWTLHEQWREHPLDLVSEAPPLSPEPDADGWIKHTPGPCPVDPKTIVEVRFKNGHETKEPWPASTWSWGRLSEGCTITHYKIIKPAPEPEQSGPKFKCGDRVRKIKGSSWHGIVVGEYSTSLTPEEYAVESEREPGSVQIYPASALELVADLLPEAVPEQSGPVRMVPQINPGKYGILIVAAPDAKVVSVAFRHQPDGTNNYTADELLAAARTLTTIGEAMK